MNVVVQRADRQFFVGIPCREGKEGAVGKADVDAETCFRHDNPCGLQGSLAHGEGQIN